VSQKLWNCGYRVFSCRGITRSRSAQHSDVCCGREQRLVLSHHKDMACQFLWEVRYYSISSGLKIASFLIIHCCTIYFILSGLKVMSCLIIPCDMILRIFLNTHKIYIHSRALTITNTCIQHLRVSIFGSYWTSRSRDQRNGDINFYQKKSRKIGGFHTRSKTSTRLNKFHHKKHSQLWHDI
jgi:hypothetical protein